MTLPFILNHEKEKPVLRMDGNNNLGYIYNVAT